MKLDRVDYQILNARQKENYNFHKVAARLADYGYTSIRLSDDIQGADFIAIHNDGRTIYRVQLKTRLTLNGKYCGKDLHLAFRHADRVFVYPHDRMIERLAEVTSFATSASWAERKSYTWPNPSSGLWSKAVWSVLADYEVKP